MCTAIEFVEDGDRCDSTDELKAKGIEAVFCDQQDDDGRNTCLCIVDIEATLTKAGYTFKTDSMLDYVAKKAVK